MAGIWDGEKLFRILCQIVKCSSLRIWNNLITCSMNNIQRAIYLSNP